VAAHPLTIRDTGGTCFAFFQSVERMHVAVLDELPPGKGKVVEMAGRRIFIFNVDGQLHATTAGRRPHGEQALLLGTNTLCAGHGQHFESWVEDAPSELEGEERCEVQIEGEVVWVVVKS
jgi:nitrite reductase/ring-hydroxylating ferredoxin subunit